MDKAKVIQVIETTLLRKGDGQPDSPIRVVTQYWTLGGKLLAEVDPFLLPPFYEMERPETSGNSGGKEQP